MKKRLSPGEIAPVSGLYEIIGPRGRPTQAWKELSRREMFCHQLPTPE